MTKPEALTIIRAKYPRAVAVPDAETRMSLLILDVLRPLSNTFRTGGDISDVCVRFAEYVLQGADF